MEEEKKKGKKKMKGLTKNQEKELRQKRREKLGTRKKERLTKTETERVNQLTKNRENWKENSKQSPSQRVLEERKWLEVLNGCEQGYSYERWEARNLWRKCMKDPEGYRVKANQKGRIEWSKERVESYEFDLRNWRSKENEKERRRTQNQSERGDGERKTERMSESDENSDEKRERGGDECGFWKYY